MPLRSQDEAHDVGEAAYVDRARELRLYATLACVGIGAYEAVKVNGANQFVRDLKFMETEVYARRQGKARRPNKHEVQILAHGDSCGARPRFLRA